MKPCLVQKGTSTFSTSWTNAIIMKMNIFMGKVHCDSTENESPPCFFLKNHMFRLQIRKQGVFKHNSMQKKFETLLLSLSPASYVIGSMTSYPWRASQILRTLCPLCLNQLASEPALLSNFDWLFDYRECWSLVLHRSMDHHHDQSPSPILVLSLQLSPKCIWLVFPLCIRSDAVTWNYVISF